MCLLIKQAGRRPSHGRIVLVVEDGSKVVVEDEEQEGQLRFTAELKSEFETDSHLRANCIGSASSCGIRFNKYFEAGTGFLGDISL